MVLAIVGAAIIVLGILVAAAYLVPEPHEPAGRRGASGDPGAHAV